jgi:hypothetical protein
VARGELAVGADRELLMDLLVGPYYHRLLVHHGRVDHEHFKAVIDVVLDGVPRR